MQETPPRPFGCFRSTGDNLPLIQDKSKETSILREEGKSRELGAPRGLPVNRYFDSYSGWSADETVKFIFDKTTTDSDQLKTRQVYLREAQKIEEDEAAREVWVEARQFSITHRYNIERVYDPVLSGDDFTVYTPRIEMYLRDTVTRGDDGNLVDDDGDYWKMQEIAESSQRATMRFVAEFEDRYPTLATEMHARRLDLDSLIERVLCPVEYIKGQGSPHGFDQLPILAQYALNDSWASKLLESVSGLSLSEIEVDQELRKIVLRDLSHSKFDRRSQETNTIEITDQPIVLTGANGSGKTHLMESIGLALMTASSVGRAAISSGEIPLLDGMAVTYRPLGGRDGYGSFGLEARQWDEVLVWLESLDPNTRKIILCDEPFSTTDPREQKVIIEKLINRLKELGAMVVMTSHSDMRDLSEAGLVSPMRFTDSGRRKRLLEAGIGDSNALEASRELGLDEELLQRAGYFLEGGSFNIDAVTSNYFNIRPSVIERYGDSNPGLGWFLPRRAASTSNHRSLMSEKQEYDWLYGVREDKSEIRSPYLSDRRNYVFGDQDIMLYAGDGFISRNTMLDRIISEGSTANLEDIEARRDFFVRLMQYPDTDKLLSELDDLASIFHSLSGSATSGVSSPLKHEDQRRDDIVGRNPLTNPMQTFAIALAQSSLLGSSRRAEGAVDDKADAYKAALTAAIELGEGRISDKKIQLLKDNIKAIEILETRISGAREVDDWRKAVVDFSPEEQDWLIEFANRAYKKAKINKHYRENTKKIFFDRDYDHEAREYLPWERRDCIGKRAAEDLLRNIMPRSRLGSIDVSVGGAVSKVFQDSIDYVAASELTESDGEAFARLLETYQDIEDSYRRRERYGSISIPRKNTINTLVYLTDPTDRLAGLKDRFTEIGGDIGISLAEYLDNEIKEYFDGAGSGIEYAQVTAKKVRKARKKTMQDVEDGKTKDRPWYIDYQIRDRLKTVAARLDVFGRRDFGIHSGKSENPVTAYSELRNLARIVHVGRVLQGQNHVITENGETLDVFRMQDKSVSARMQRQGEPEIKTSIRYESLGGIDIISGSNMSGKTTFGKSLFHNLIRHNSIGLVETSGAVMPNYANVVYIDRPKQDAGKGLSSHGADTENWVKALELLDDAAPSFVFIDEPWSGTSDKYQEALTLACIERLAAKGHRVVVATHNNDVIDRLEEASDRGDSAADIEFHNLRTDLTLDGDVEFKYEYVEGRAPSMAVQVARKIGYRSLASVL